MLSSLKISTRIYLMALLYLVLVALVGGVALVQMNRIGIALIDIAEEDMPISHALTRVTEHQLTQAVLFERALGYGMATELGHNRHAQLSTLSAEFNQLSKTIGHELQETRQQIHTALQNPHSNEARQAFSQLQSRLTQIEQEHQQYTRQAMAVIQQILQGSSQAILHTADQLIILEDRIDHALIEALNQVQTFTLAATRKAEHDELQAQQTIGLLFAVALITGLLLPLVLARSITGPVQSMRNSLQELADGEGDLGVRLPLKGNNETTEAAAAFNQLMERLNSMMDRISDTSRTLVQQSHTTTEVMDTTCNQIEQQKQETRQVVEAVESMAHHIHEVAQSTEEAANQGLDVMQRVHTGMESAQQSQGVIEQLSGNMNRAANEIQALAAETSRISEVLESITGIAEQTNLLALNAAIEAARAGDSGRGFAVVADEVRSLSKHTQSSTEDIRQLLDSLQNETGRAVASMQEGCQQAQTCLNQARSTATELSQACISVDSMAALNTQIAAASEEQAVTAQRINDNLHSIADYADQTSQSADQTSEASQQMANALDGLHGMVNKLRA
ncbi:MAG: methyl-accepting chemotaxis protein [Marinobacterium sp.]|nr:methyl-accepting chemotaxis protein [Marinobacterium sp.]